MPVEIYNGRVMTRLWKRGGRQERNKDQNGVVEVSEARVSEELRGAWMQGLPREDKARPAVRYSLENPSGGVPIASRAAWVMEGGNFQDGESFGGDRQEQLESQKS